MNKDKVHHIDAITNQMKQGIGSDLVLEGISLSLLKFWMGETETKVYDAMQKQSESSFDGVSSWDFQGR